MSTLDMTNINIQICKYANIRADTKNMPTLKNNALYVGVIMHQYVYGD